MKMPITNLIKNALSEEIARTFPIVEMPKAEKILVPGRGDEYIAEELERFRNKELDGVAIRLVHQEMSSLTAEAWCWILPHYLRFCLTPEAEYNRMETEFLIYNLGPEPQFQANAAARLSLLTSQQISTLVNFLNWCLCVDYWRENFSTYLQRGVEFLSAVLRSKGASG